MRILSIVCICLIISSSALSNNVSVANVRLTNQNVTTDVKDIEFDISWENSWRTSASPANYDACWLFAKYRLTNSTIWNHASVSATDGDHTAPAGSTIDAMSDGKGLFIFRDADGAGNNSWENVRINWTYGLDGLADNDSVEIAVFAVEMVYIPEGGFTLGDGNGTTKSSFSFESFTNNETALSIGTTISETLKTDAAVSIDDATLGTTGIRLDGDGGLDEDNDGVVDHPNFPVGYNAIYCMKYEISQGQYVAFLNTLNSTQANLLITNQTVDDNRQRISGTGTSWTSIYPERPVRLGWIELCAYLDWSGLRPMSETEFEKICRGPSVAVLREYAWGSTNVFNSSYIINGDGSGSSTLANPGSATGNASFTTTDDLLDGPLRCGIFAASSNNNSREETGGTFYGVMEMSGNLSEQAVFLGDPDGRDFDGSHGDGEISSNGYGNVSGWPSFNGSENRTNDSGFSVRGGGWNLSDILMSISNRANVTLHPLSRTAGSNGVGGRGVRTPE
ncbi:MAG: SUMF1/EgtB/PvdO family nonheme iron enzyme [Bacteroidota bacterium]